MRIRLSSFLSTALALAPGVATAQVPEGYEGTPYMGTPAAIPGRIEFENFDDGGSGVAFQVVHAGDIGCTGGDYRADPKPTLCQTNVAPEVDEYEGGGLYPSDANPNSHYIGATRPGDWVKITVNVAQAGTYHLSSTWATDGTAISISLKVNDVEKGPFMLDGTAGYHSWVEYPSFATIDLEAGLQVIQFTSNEQHLNYDYLTFELDGEPLPTAGAGGQAGQAGAGGAGVGAGGAATAGGGAGGAPSAGSAGAPAAGGSQVSVGSGGTAGAAGSPSPGSAGSLAVAGAAGAMGNVALPMSNDVDSQSGCFMSVAPRPGSGSAMLAAAAFLLVLSARRRR